MGWLADIGRSIGIPVSSPEVKMTSAELDSVLRGSGQSGSGANVNWNTALQVATVLACTRVIAEGVSQVPWKLHRGDGSREAAADHPVYDLIYRRPNAYQTSFEFRETMALHLVLTGNAFVQKMVVGSRRELRALEIIEPGRMAVEVQPDGRVKYFATDENGRREVDPASIWHVRGPSWNGYVGLDVTRLAREAIGLAMATEATHADFHRNGARVSGSYSVQNILSPDRFKQLSAWMDRHSQGGDRAGKPLILDQGAKFESHRMAGKDAEHVDTRKYQAEEICRAMRVMPIMVGLSDKASTYASAEQMFLAHVTHTLMPWFERIEQSADVNLLSENDRRDGLYTKFNPNALMRGAAADRGEFYAKALGAGGTPAWMTQDEVRGLEEMAPQGGAASQLNPGAMGLQNGTD